MKKTNELSRALPVIAFSIVYLLIGSWYFVSASNIEFVIYIVVIVGILALLFGTLRLTKLPTYLLWLISIWGLMHILGGAVHTSDGVLFAYRIHPFIDHGGDFYVLKYDQVVHTYLYGTLTLIFFHLQQRVLNLRGSLWLMLIVAMMASVGVSAMNEIMEFLISIIVPSNGVGGYENTLLDLISNFTGSLIAASALAIREWKRR